MRLCLLRSESLAKSIDRHLFIRRWLAKSLSQALTNLFDLVAVVEKNGLSGIFSQAPSGDLDSERCSEFLVSDGEVADLRKLIVDNELMFPVAHRSRNHFDDSQPLEPTQVLLLEVQISCCRDLICPCFEFRQHRVWMIFGLFNHRQTKEKQTLSNFPIDRPISMP